MMYELALMYSMSLLCDIDALREQRFPTEEACTTAGNRLVGKFPGVDFWCAGVLEPDDYRR